MRPDDPIYEIRIEGRLSAEWSGWFNGMTISVQDARDGAGYTTLTGPIIDQARLRGILDKLWDMNLTVISVRRLTGGAT